jgi:RNA polymerase sigma factor (sigma-70 family)
MGRAGTGSIVRLIQTLFDEGSIAGLTDGQLLERFIARDDAAGELAFAALVDRHGPMVRRVCRQILGNRHHAEDAAQAVFLVLARKPRSVRDPDRLGVWLYGVAVRTARKAHARLRHLRRNEESDSMKSLDSGSVDLLQSTLQPAEEVAIAREHAQALHDEIDRLPNSFRAAVVLCYFEGLALDEAARRLRWPAGTVRSRLARARHKLHRALTRRGIVLPAAAFATLLETTPASASISSPAGETTTRAVIKLVAGKAGTASISTFVAALAREVIQSMVLQKMRRIAITLLFFGAVAAGVGYSTMSLESRDEPKGAHSDPGPQVAAKPDVVPPAPNQMLVIGRVLDPDGKTLAGAQIYIVGRPRAPRVATAPEPGRWVLVGRGASDGEGRIRLVAARTQSTRFDLVHALAAAPGFGLGWVQLNPDAEEPKIDIRLQPEQVIRGRAFDINGQPAAGVEIVVGRVGRFTETGPFEGIDLGQTTPPDGLLAWPRPVKTDEQGRFSIAGIARGCPLAVVPHDPRFAFQWLEIDTGTRNRSSGVTLTLQPSTIIEGRVLAADTDRPIPFATIHIMDGRLSGYLTRFRADERGRFTANPSPGSYFEVSACPPAGEPYLSPKVGFAWTKGSVKRTLDLRLPRGVLIRGKVSEQGTGRPLPGCSIQYIPTRAPRGDRTVVSGLLATVDSEAEGSFQIAVPGRKGHLLVFGPTPDYVLGEIGFNKLYEDTPGGVRYYAHAIIPYEVKAGDRPLEVSAVLRPGVTIKGRALGPEGQPIAGGVILTPIRVEPTSPQWRGNYQFAVHDGRFELHGQDPGATTRISILDPGHEWGATVVVSGKQAGEELTVRLQPCGKAMARFVGPDGKPVANRRVGLDIYFVATPGPPEFSRNQQERAELTADSAFIFSIDRKHYARDRYPVTDAEGRYTMISLVPGATYRISDYSARNIPDKGVQVRKDFTVKPGETLDLGDILIEKPQPNS